MTTQEFIQLNDQIDAKITGSTNDRKKEFWTKLKGFLAETLPLIIDHTKMSFIQKAALKVLIKVFL
jgi:hypothetical protein